VIAVVEWHILVATFFGLCIAVLPIPQYYVYAYEADATAPCKLDLGLALGGPAARK